MAITLNDEQQKELLDKIEELKGMIYTINANLKFFILTYDRNSKDENTILQERDDSSEISKEIQEGILQILLDGDVVKENIHWRIASTVVFKSDKNEEYWNERLINYK